MEKNKPRPIDYDKGASFLRATLGVKRMTQKVVIQETGVSPIFLSQFINRRCNLTQEDLEKVFAFLDIPVESVLIEIETE